MLLRPWFFRRRASRAEQGEPPQAPVAATADADLAAELTKLNDLQESGALSPAEFEAAKRKLLSE